MIIIAIVIIVILLVVGICFYIQNRKEINKQPFSSVWEDKNDKGQFYKDITKDIIKNTQKLTKDQNIELVPNTSSLLGLVRHKGFIPWDNYVSICIDKKYFTVLLNLKDELAKRNIGILKHGQFIKLYSLDGEKIKGVEWTWPFIDISSYEEKDGYIFISDSSSKNLKINLSDFFPLRSNLFEGIPMSLPNNPDAIIEKIYGKDWEETCISSSVDYRNHKQFHNLHKIDCKNINKINHDLFDNVWVINLDRRPDRWELTKNRLNQININPKRFKAVDAQDPEIIKFYSNLSPPRRKIGEVACYLSHKKLWEHIYKLNIPYALIFEDDIIISPEIGRKDIKDALDESLGFDIIFLGHCGGIPRYKMPFLFGEYIFSDVNTRPGYPQCLHAYIISRKAIENLLNQPDDFTQAIDEITQEYCTSHLCFLSRHVPIEAKTFGSGIILQDEDITSNIRKFR